MPLNGPEPTSGRETRLLLLVIVVSLGVLLLLARFRFPAATIATVSPSPGPLAGMAARATFEEMSATLAGVLARAQSAVDVVRLERVPPAEASAPGTAGPAPADDATAGGQDAPPAVAKSLLAAPDAVAVGAQALPARRFAPALRVRPDLALLHVPAGWQPAGTRDLASPLEVAWSDPGREIAAVRLPLISAALPGLPASAANVTGFLYVGVLLGTRSGPTIQPAFIGRAETETDARWSAPLVVLSGGPALPSGSLVYTIDGRLVGLAMAHDTGVAIVPAAALDDAVTRLTGAGVPPE